MVQACEAAGVRLELVAVNHWARAVETHSHNHPAAHHHCESLLTLDPCRAVPGGRLDLLIAAPECVHHSNARGGKPRSEQSRATAWCVQRWCTALRIDRVLVENVPEFETWGPLGYDGKPLKSRRGETFRAWVRALESLNYRVAWKVLNAADFGAATSRRRLFVQAVKGRRPIVWPDPTHAKKPAGDGLFATRQPWRAAREVIDWTLTGESIFTRKRPLSDNTIRRIEAGLRKFGGAAAEPFLFAMNYLKSAEHDNRNTKPVTGPIPTVTGQGNRFYLAEPFIVPHRQFDRMDVDSVDGPLRTITATNGHLNAVCEPFAVSAGGPEVGAQPVSGPLNTVLTRPHMGIVQPFLVPTFNGEREGQAPRCHSVDAPAPTVVASRPTHALVEPFVVTSRNGCVGQPIGSPVPTITAGRPAVGVCEPFTVRVVGAGDDNCRVKPLADPLGTVTTSGAHGVCEPFMVPYYGTGGADSIADPARTVTANDRLGLVQPDGTMLDIRFRMLQPHELAAAMGFPRDYRLTGNRADQVRQVGNAVEVNVARALCGAILAGGGA